MSGNYIKKFFSAPITLADDCAGFHRSGTLIMSIVALVLILLALVLNFYIDQHHLLPPMLVAGGLTTVNTIWLYKRPFAKIPLYCNSMVLAVLGISMIIGQGTFSGTSLMWFLLTPPMLIFCLGLTRGTIIFMGFYLVLMLLFLGPYSNAILSASYFNITRVFLLLFGIFLFSWVAEYARHRTQEALILLNRHLEREARTDSLTGLGNRREFNEHFRWLQSQAQRNCEPFSLAMADIDHFKRINDNYGHQVGDQVLRHVAQLISGTLRAADRVFRWGGEEFVILMPSTTSTEGVFMAERLRKLLQDSPFSSGELLIPITLSLGVYSGSTEENLDEHIRQVDARLYAAKNCGRNQVCSGLYELSPANEVQHAEVE